MAEPSKLAAALFRLQERAIALKKDAAAVYGQYATLGNVMEVLRPHLAEEGILVMQSPAINGPNPALVTTLYHVESGESQTFTAPLILEKETGQGMGAAITYMRRYMLVSIFFLDADEDDDGNSAEPAKATVKKRSGDKEEASRVKARVL